MARDVKLIQRGVNVQANDLAVPPGTPTRALNIDFQRDGVAARRQGFNSFYAGLPWGPLDSLATCLDNNTSEVMPDARAVFELFSRNRPMMIHGGFCFAYDETQARWQCVPVQMPHRYTFFGNNAPVLGCSSGIGRAVLAGFAAASGSATGSAFCAQAPSNSFLGAIGNAASDVRLSGTPGTTLGRFAQPKDVIDEFAVDQNVIRNMAFMDQVYAGSLTASGAVDGTGTAALFSNPNWAASPLAGGTSAMFVCDNANQIRKVTIIGGGSGGVVTTFAGSVTAGTADGVGTAARFTNLIGITTDDAQFLYTLEAGGKIRKVDFFSGSVTTIATGAGGGGGGIEYVDGNLYVCASGGKINKITPGGVKTVYCGGNIAGGSDFYGSTFSGCYFSDPSAVLRGKFTAGGGATTYLIVENVSQSDSSMMDVVLVPVTVNAGEQNVYHIVRCPSGYPNGTNGPNKMDAWGPNTFGLAEARGVDVGSGVMFATSERPLAVDIWTAHLTTDPQPRLRQVGIYSPEAPLTAAVSGSTFAPSMTVAYRVVCGESLTDGRIALGPPSERIICAGSATAAWSGSITAYPAPGLTYDGIPFMQLYRTRAVANTLDPGDQMFLCYETALTYGAGVAISDQLPDELLGAELYTNATEDGSAAARLPPPVFATEVALFNKSAMVANYLRLSTLTFKVLGTSTLIDGTSTITITANCKSPFNEAAAHNPTLTGAFQITLTAISGATAPASNKFQIGTGGTATQNAVQTARNIVACINRSPDCFLFTARYDESDPGAVIVTCLFPGYSKNVTATIPSTFAGNKSTTATQASVSLSTNAAAAFVSTANAVTTRDVNAVAYSDELAFDSFPATNEFTVGSGTEAVQRLLPISDTLLAVKEQLVWRMDSSFVPTIYDKALACSQPHSFAMVNNQWIGLFTRGFVALNASQAIALGRPIDREVTAQYGQFSGSRTEDLAFAAGIDLSGNYLCAFNKRAFCFNVISQSWSDWSNMALADRTTGESGITVVGAFRDSFISCLDGARGVLRQRRWQRDGSNWHKDYADQDYTFTSCTLAADLQTITLGAYDATVNAGTLPPQPIPVPAGAIDSATNDAAAFWWALEIVKGGVTELAFGTVVATTPSSPTSAITIKLVTPLATISAGTVNVTAHPPIVCRVQYAPFAAPGGNAGFGDLLVTVERAQPGWLVSRFFNRRDHANALVTAFGEYDDDQGVSRAILMPSVTTPNANGVGSKLVYFDERRVPVPRERAVDQQVAVELWEGTAWQPLAIKVVTLDKNDSGNSKVTQ